MLVEVGAAGRMLIDGVPITVHPIEDAKLLEAAKPVANGKIAPDRKKIEAREDAMVRRMLDRPVAIAVLGGGHDLADNVRRLTADCEYIRVALKRYEMVRIAIR